MSQSDPHVHVESKVVRSAAAVRNMLAATFGLAADVPPVVTTGCGLLVPYAMTSERPESVTCLSCRDYARRQHSAFAETIEQRLSRTPAVGTNVPPAGRTAQAHRDLAERFGGTG
jgi:hypothetical protein